MNPKQPKRFPGRYEDRPPRRAGPKPIPLDPKDVEALAEACLTKRHLAEELGISEDTLQRRLDNDSEFREAYNAGLRKLRRHVASTLLRHAETNAIAAITLANQPNILGFQNPNQRIEGKIEHQITMSPAMLAFAKRREQQRLSGAPKGDLAQDADVIEIDGE